MPLADLRSDLEAIEKEPALREEAGFVRRAEALDSLELRVLDRIDGLLREPEPPEGLLPLRRRAERARRRLEAVDRRLFRRLRAELRAGAPLPGLIEAFVGRDAPGRRGPDEAGYDVLDAFVDALLVARPVPAPTRELEPGMVPYQRTPARVVREMADRGGLAPGDLFFDLGSGLGQVPILVSLLTGAAARGVEREPAYCAFARATAAELALPRVEFVLADAREADLSGGTVFFLYSPFEGAILAEVLERLRRLARDRPIRLFTYGPCTAPVAREGWLVRLGPGGDHPHRLAAFRGPRAP